MQNLINFLYRFRTFGFFLLLEVVCAWLIVGYNQRQNASFLNSSNYLVASINSMTHNSAQYVRLVNINEQLLAENELLRNQLAQVDNYHILPDSNDITSFSFVGAKVIKNTYQRSQNYFTLDIGSEAGVSPGMGVISKDGVIGQVKSVSENFATVTSLLHINLLVSSAIKSSNTLCTVQWDGLSPYEAEVKYIPRHVVLQEGDSVVTSGYNSVFPADVMLGTVSAIKLTDRDAFYEARIRLSTDFTSLVHGYVVKNQQKAELDSLEFISTQQ